MNVTLHRLFSLIRMKYAAVLLLALAPMGLAAQDLQSLDSGAKADLQKATDELNAVRKQKEADLLPLAKKQTALEQTLLDRKAALAKADREQENRLTEKNALKAEAKLRSEEVKFIDSILGEYAKDFRTRLNFVEDPVYQSMFAEFDKVSVAPDLTPAERFTKESVVLTTALKRTEAVLGGELLEGKALDKRGLVQPGKVALIGPVAMFASDSDMTAGVLQQELNKAEPTVVPLDKDMIESSRALAATGTGQMALDATGGNAFKLSALKESLIERLAKGGWIMVPLLSLGVGAILVAFFKWIQLARVRLVTEMDLQKVLRHLENRENEKAMAIARGISGMAGSLLATAVEHADEKKEYIEEIVYEKMLGARAKLERGIAFLALTATTGPLMGLLGTVMGMIATFKLISSFGSGDPKMLAAGISEALICTATGMAVAIPALLCHAFLSRKAKGVIGSMEQTAVGFINGVPESETPTFA
jgi:biopolymer transport protein ExbB